MAATPNRLMRMLHSNDSLFPTLSSEATDAEQVHDSDPKTKADLVSDISTEKIISNVPNPIPPNHDYIDPYVFSSTVTAESRQAIKTQQLENDPKYIANTSCPLTDDELLNLTLIFTLWTGIDVEGVTPDGREYRPWTYQEILDELNNVRAFMKNELNTTFGLTGTMAKINESMFMNELDKFEEDQLMGYATLFHIDLRHLDDIQTSISESYFTYTERHTIVSPEKKMSMPDDEELVTRGDLFDIQEDNLGVYLRELKSTILQFKIDLMDRLRLWRWREEVIVGQVEQALDVYPGEPVTYYFETAGEIFENGIDSYFIRVGDVKRETLMDRFKFVDLYHMAGMLATYYPRQVDFSTGMEYEDLADMITEMVETISFDNRQLLSPLGFYTVHNSEKLETQYKFQNKEIYLDVDALILAAGHAGIDIDRDTEVVYDTSPTSNSNLNPNQNMNGEGSVDASDLTTERDSTLRRDRKPEFVLAEEIISQYVSPQFFSGIESHRNYQSAITTLRTLSGIRVEHTPDIDFIFHGVGDGVSRYRVYTVKELADVFSSYEDFFDPYSVRDHQEEPFKWSRFSVPSINRLIRVVLPSMRQSNQGTSVGAEKRREAIDYLEQVIESTFTARVIALADLSGRLQRNGLEGLTVRDSIEPRVEQWRIVNKLQRNIDLIRPQFAQFLVFLFNTGIQFSDWSTTMTRIDDNAVQYATEWVPGWKHIDPETTANLNEKIFKMLTLDVERYSHIIVDQVNQTVGEDLKDGVPEGSEDYSRLLMNLRLVKHYKGAYRIEWYDELATIEGHLYRMRKANDLSYYAHLKASGNWLMATAQYYAIEILGIALTDEQLQLTDVPSTPEQLIEVSL